MKFWLKLLRKILYKAHFLRRNSLKNCDLCRDPTVARSKNSWVRLLGFIHVHTFKQIFHSYNGCRKSAIQFDCFQAENFWLDTLHFSWWETLLTSWTRFISALTSDTRETTTIVTYLEWVHCFSLELNSSKQLFLTKSHFDF